MDEKAFLLHSQAYGETSLIIHILTMNHGRIALFARGAKRATSTWKNALQPFILLSVHWQGRRELKQLTQAEINNPSLRPSGQKLWCGLYLNELLMRLLLPDDSCYGVFKHYHDTLLKLQQGEKQQILLRCFEKQLLSELGYQVPIDGEMDTGRPFSKDQYYYYHPKQGFSAVSKVLSQSLQGGSAQHIFSGQSLLAIQKEQWSEPRILNDAKRLFNIAIQPLLNKPLLSPKIFSYCYQTVNEATR